MRSTVGKVVYARGLNLVVIILTVHPPWGGTPIALPVNVRVHRKNDPTTTIGHAAAMITQIAGWFGDRRLHVVADGAYATLAGTRLPRTHLTARMRRDAALYQPPPPRTGKPGRPRTKGERLPTPADLSTSLPAHRWTHTQIQVRGTTRTLLVHVQDVLWYRVNKTDLVRLVIVRDPDGTQPDDYFFTTDLTATPEAVITRYTTRWAIEVCFRDVKQHLGGQDPQTWKRQGPERAAALSLWLHALTWCWYLTHHPDGTWTPRPWYPTKTTPSFLDALATLRKALWATEYPPRQAPNPTPPKSPTQSSTPSPTPHNPHTTLRKSTGRERSSCGGRPDPTPGCRTRRGRETPPVRLPPRGDAHERDDLPPGVHADDLLSLPGVGVEVDGRTSR